MALCYEKARAKDQIKFDFANSNGASSLKVSMIDMMGRVVASEVLETNKSSTTKQYALNISHLDAGMYFLAIEANGKSARGKFIVSK